MQRIEIIWDDAAYNNNAWERKEIDKDFGLMELASVGWLVTERPDCYVIATEYDKDQDRFRHVCAIPKSGIKSMRKFRGK